MEDVDRDLIIDKRQKWKEWESGKMGGGMKRYRNAGV